MSKRKIWQLVDGRSIGGIERHVATLVTALRYAGHDAEVVLWRAYEQSPWLEQLRADCVPHRALEGSFWSLLAVMRRERPDLVHTHGYKANIFGRIVARMLGVPVVSTFHAGERPGFPVSLYQDLDTATSFLATRIAVSREIAGKLPWRAHIVRNFLVPPRIAPTDPLPRRVGFIGRLSHEKGPDLFCEMARASPPGLEWHVWGDGPMRASLLEAHGNRVVFHGLTLDVSTALRSIGLLAMPSRAEGLPMAALEALAAGVPVLASSVGGLPDLVKQGSNGWLFAAGDIASALAHVDAWSALDDDERAAMRGAAHATVLENYSDAAMIPVLLGIYTDAGLGKRRTTTTAPTLDPPGTLRSSAEER